MKGIEQWATEFSTHKIDCTCKASSKDERLEAGFIAGFKAARERIASFVDVFNYPKAMGILIRAIGEGHVEDKDLP